MKATEVIKLLQAAVEAGGDAEVEFRYFDEDADEFVDRAVNTVERSEWKTTITLTT